jgi:ketosteroid isomerase-like protein
MHTLAIGFSANDFENCKQPQAKERIMKRMWIWCLLAAVSVVSVASLHAKPADDTAKAVEALEMQWLKGQKTDNPDLIAPLLADKIVVTDGDGKVTDKAETIAWYKKVHFDAAEYSDLKVAVYGDAAVATGGFKGKGTDAMGKPFDDNDRWTDTWVKMPSGKWQCVASQVSRVKM